MNTCFVAAYVPQENEGGCATGLPGKVRDFSVLSWKSRLDFRTSGKLRIKARKNRTITLIGTRYISQFADFSSSWLLNFSGNP